MIFLVLLILFSFVESANATIPAPYTCLRTFNIATTGSDGATCGAAGSPCASIQGANNATSIGNTGTPLQGGDCVKLAAGTYNTTVALNITRGGSSNQATGYVVYVGAANHASIINWSGGTPYNGMLFSTSYLIFDGLDFNGNL